jgi:hypothetical protein
LSHGIERLLRQSLKGRAQAAPTAPCLDAETLAAWVDGSLVGDQLSIAESHLSDCGRCLALLTAMAKTPRAAAAERRWQGVPLRWLVPLMAGAIALTIWIRVPNDQPSRAPEQTVARTQDVPAERSPQGPSTARPSPAADADRNLRASSTEDRVDDKRAQGRAEAASELDRLRGVATEPAPTRQAPATVDTFRAAGRIENISPAPSPQAAPAFGAERGAVEGERRERVSGETPIAPASPAAVAAPAEATSADSFRRFNAASLTSATRVDIVSPDASIRWRVGPRGFVQLSRDRGTTWDSLSSGVTTDLTAGSSPSPSVCWLVGRGGTVLVTSDGRTWQRVMFPEAIDLVTVRASDMRTATITAVDGRSFTTTDGGRTWNR